MLCLMLSCNFSDAFDLRYGVAILRLQGGLDFSHLTKATIKEGKVLNFVQFCVDKLAAVCHLTGMHLFCEFLNRQAWWLQL